MDHKIIFEEYTKASNKVKYIKEKAKTLGVYDSDIICELFKSGYKFEELKRANKATYNAGMKKYEKWKENGSPEDEEADALERTEPEQSEPAPSTRVDEENYKPEDYIAHLEKVLKEQEEKITELISTNQYLEDNNKIYMDENCQLRTKVQKCEAFIINQMVYVDHSDFGLKNCCLINLDLSKMTEDEKEKFFKSQRWERMNDQ